MDGTLYSQPRLRARMARACLPRRSAPEAFETTRILRHYRLRREILAEVSPDDLWNDVHRHGCSVRVF